MNRYYDPAIRTETLEESETTIISTDPRVEPFFHELKDGYEVKYTEDNLPLIVKIPELTEQEKNEVVWNHFRSIRNSKLVETDWWANSDLTMTEDQIAYRKALRDLSSTASPELDSDGNLTGVTWPTKPE
jgi:hypothetical protein